MQKSMESAENYLETILILKEKNGSVRSIDIAHELDFSKPSVSVAMKRLRGKELITVDDGGLIELTEEGRALAENIYERHVILTKALMSLGVTEDTASEDACRIEHYISQETFDRIKDHFYSYSN